MTLLDLAVVGLASWRLAHMMVWERGPFNLLVGIRHLAGIRHEEGQPVFYPDNPPARLFSCVWCMSVWTAVVTWALWVPLVGITTIPAVLVLLLAVSGVAVIIDSIVHQG